MRYWHPATNPNAAHNAAFKLETEGGVTKLAENAPTTWLTLMRCVPSMAVKHIEKPNKSPAKHKISPLTFVPVGQVATHASRCSIVLFVVFPQVCPAALWVKDLMALLTDASHVAFGTQ
jgi:hypothetical protein